MTKKISRILGIIGGALTLLPWLWMTVQCAWALLHPYSAANFESKGYTSGFLVFSVLYSVISLAGLIGSLLVCKKRILAGVLMIVSGALMFAFGLPMLLLGTRWLIKLPPVLLVAAGVLSLASPSGGGS